MHDRDWTYSWYEPDTNKNSGDAGFQNLGSCSGSQCDTYAYTNAVNANALCGATNWRLPTEDEFNTYNPFSLYKTYFPNNLPSKFWSSTLYFNNSSKTWGVAISEVDSAGFGGRSASKNRLYNVQLVREDRLPEIYFEYPPLI